MFSPSRSQPEAHLASGSSSGLGCSSVVWHGLRRQVVEGCDGTGVLDHVGSGLYGFHGAAAPGDYLRDELEERGWTVTEFAT